MNIKYLQEVIIPQRNSEIEAGLNAGTRQPIYVVMDLNEQICSGHNDYSVTTNRKGLEQKFGYIDLAVECEDRVFKLSDKRMKEPDAVTRFYSDSLIAFFLTRKAAKEYMEYQSHNLSKHAYIYVFYTGYGNIEMDNLFAN